VYFSKTQVRSQVRLCVICGGRSGTGAGFPFQFSFHRLLHTHISPEAGTIVADVPSGLSLTPGQEIKICLLLNGNNHQGTKSKWGQLQDVQKPMYRFSHLGVSGIEPEVLGRMSLRTYTRRYKVRSILRVFIIVVAYKSLFLFSYTANFSLTGNPLLQTAENVGIVYSSINRIVTFHQFGGFVSTEGKSIASFCNIVLFLSTL
jgi:hypothetical protein